MTLKDTNADDLRASNEASIDAWRDFLDLSVPLVIELGRTRLSVREILELEAHGDNRQLARGEIIMIEDRTGVRINDMIVQED